MTPRRYKSFHHEKRNLVYPRGHAIFKEIGFQNCKISGWQLTQLAFKTAKFMGGSSHNFMLKFDFLNPGCTKIYSIYRAQIKSCSAVSVLRLTLV